MKIIFADILLLFLFNSFECRLSFGRNIRFNRNQVLKQDPPVSELYYDQRLDHFKEALKNTWKQVCLIYYNFVFLFLNKSIISIIKSVIG